MGNNILIKNASIVNRGNITIADVFIKNERIEKIDQSINLGELNVQEINAENLHLLPGAIDDQVHFREPGLTHKANIATESAAAAAGGVTSFMEMPNTNPATLTQELLEEKYKIGQQTSTVNYSFFMGVSNTNVDEVLRTNDKKNNVCGVKIFMGSSTGDMLVDNYLTLNKIFSESELLIATHCESESVIAANKEKYSNADHARFHPLIRNEQACFESSFSAVQLAKQTNARLHILHISTSEELKLFGNMLPLNQKRITSEVCVHHLHFTAHDYEKLGNLIKCNPAIKDARHQPALWEALLDDRLDIIATDHAPHTWDEKSLGYQQAPSGLPLVQHSLPLMLKYVNDGKISIQKVVEKMSHAPAICFQIAERGYIDEGYYADVVLVDMQQHKEVNKSNIHYKCGWSPLEGTSLPTIVSTYVNGKRVYDNGSLTGVLAGKRLTFTR